MAKVDVYIGGAEPIEIEADTVGELREELELPHHICVIGDDTVDDDFELSDNEQVAFNVNVKGGVPE